MVLLILISCNNPDLYITISFQQYISPFIIATNLLEIFYFAPELIYSLLKRPLFHAAAELMAQNNAPLSQPPR